MSEHLQQREETPPIKIGAKVRLPTGDVFTLKKYEYGMLLGSTEGAPNMMVYLTPQQFETYGQLRFPTPGMTIKVEDGTIHIEEVGPESVRGRYRETQEETFKRIYHVVKKLNPQFDI